MLHAYLVHDERRVDPRAICGEIRTQQGGVLAALDFHDDGSNGDATGNDRIYTAVVAPDASARIDFKGAQLVEVHAETKSGEQRNATTGFLYSIPLAHLTGRYRDEIVDGNLVVSAEVQVDARGALPSEATLAESDGTPFGWAQNAQVLEAGTAWIPLTYWGLMLREHQANGPYLLAVGGALDDRRDAEPEERRGAERLRDEGVRRGLFSDRAFNDPGLLDAAARLRAESAGRRPRSAGPMMMRRGAGPTMRRERWRADC